MNINNFLLATSGFLMGFILSTAVILTISYLTGFLSVTA